jgi:2-C-methyl-D-erythritol 4-phosphate cytidylyltransferase
MTVSAVVLAAGRGERMCAEIHKAFLELAGRPIFAYSVEALSHVPRVKEVIVVVHPDDLAAAHSVVTSLVRRATVVTGGATRRESSLAGIRAATGEIVLIHDGCRPFASPILIDRIIDHTERYGAAVPVLPSVETLYRLGGAEHRIENVLDRASIVRAQTPQGFRRLLLLRCLEAADPGITDDASALIAQGEPVFTLDEALADRSSRRSESRRERFA